MAASFAIVLVAYFAYALAAVPLIEPSADLRKTGSASQEDLDAARVQVPQQRKELAAWFKEGDWELSNPIVLETPDGKLLLQSYEPLDEADKQAKFGPGAQGHFVQIKPCTMIFFPSEKASSSEEERNRQAVILRSAQGAILEFDAPFDLRRFSVGNLIGGELEGPFTIHSDQRSPGPEDDLFIAARDARLQQGRIESPHPIEFRFGPNYGSGRSLRIELIAGQPKPGNRGGGANFEGIRSFELHHDVHMHVEPSSDVLAPKSDGSGEATPVPTIAATNAEQSQDGAKSVEPPLEIACEGPFRFDLEEYVATFQQRVNVLRLVPDGPSDSLNCEHLALYFTPREETPAKPGQPAKKPGAFPKLEPGRIEARGNPVVLQSPADAIEAQGRFLRYDLQTGAALLEGRPTAMLRRGESVIRAPELQFRPNAAGRWGEFSAVGAGWLQGTLPEDETQRFQAQWGQAVHLKPDESGEQVLSMTGGAAVVLDGQGRISAEQIFAWLPQETEQPSSASDDSPPLLPNRLNATGNVRFDFAQVEGAVDNLQVWFERQAADPAPAASPPAPAGPRPAPAPAQQPPPSPKTAPQPPLQKFRVQGKLIQALVSVQGESIDLGVLRVQDGVRLTETQTAEPGEMPFTLVGDWLSVNQTDPAASIVTLVGQPARVAGRGMSLAGEFVRLNRTTNHLLVDTPGEMTLPVDRDLDGEPTAGAVPLSITWNQKLELAGTSAHFHGDVVARQQDRQMRTDSMEVIMTEPIVFSSLGPERARPEVAQIICRNGVQIESRTFEQGDLASAERMELLDLTIDQITGNISGRGPGRLRLVRRGSMDVLGGESTSGGPIGNSRPAPGFGGGTKPARPPQRDDGLTFLGVWFEHDLSGNLHRREMTFRDRVRTTYAPVPDWTSEVEPTDFDDPTQEGMLLNCDKLKVAQLSPAADGKRYLELLAEDNTKIEGQNYDGSFFAAQASRLTYAEAKDLLVLEGDGRSDARLWSWEQVGGPRSEAVFRKILFWRTTKEAYVDDAQVVDFSLLPSGPPDRR